MGPRTLVVVAIVPHRSSRKHHLVGLNPLGIKMDLIEWLVPVVWRSCAMVSRSVVISSNSSGSDTVVLNSSARCSRDPSRPEIMVKMAWGNFCSQNSFNTLSPTLGITQSLMYLFKVSVLTISRIVSEGKQLVKKLINNAIQFNNFLYN